MKTFIKNTTIITQNKNRDFIKNGYILINGKNIEKVGSGDIAVGEECEVIDGKDYLILPGFINTHIHLGESIYKYFISGKYSLEKYLEITNNLTRKTKTIEMNREGINKYSLLCLFENGTTVICGGRTRESSSEWGMKNFSGYMLMNSHKLKKYYNNVSRQFDNEYRETEKDKNCYPAIFIHSLNCVDKEKIESVSKIIKKYRDVKIFIHVAETKQQEDEIVKKWGCGSVEVLNEYGLLNKNTLLIHCNWINNKDISLIRETDSTIVHCLSSGLKVADKIIDISNVIDKGLRVCLATDGVVTSGTFSLINELKINYFYHNSKNNNYISGQKLLDMITINAAHALDIENQVGSIEKGKNADLVLVKKSDLGDKINNKEDAINGLTFYNNNVNISGLLNNGVVKIWNKKVLFTNKNEIINNFNEIVETIKEDINESNSSKSTL